MSDTMWVDVNEVIKSYKAAGIKCQIMSDKRTADTLICQSDEQETFSKWHDISVGFGVEVDEDFFESYPQKSTAQLARDIEFLQKNYDGAREEIKEMKLVLDDANRLTRLQSTTISRLRQLCGEAADWMKNEIIHESEDETVLREELDMQSHR